MAVKIHEEINYQKFLISDRRKNLLNPMIYMEFLKNRNSENILDFGCGLGYVTLYYALKFRTKTEKKIYACDYQEDLLDSLWQSATKQSLTNITPFFMPDRSHLVFAGWIPKMDDVIFSLSLSGMDDPSLALKTLRPVLNENGLIHIIEWDKDKTSTTLDDWLRPSERQSENRLRFILQQADYHIVETHHPEGPVFAVTASPQN